MWFRRRRKRDVESADKNPDRVVMPVGFDTGIGDEVEAFLTGRLALWLQMTGRPVPPAAWLNQVVHATAPELALLATEQTDLPQPSRWRRAVGCVSRGLLERACETGRPIDELQREFLVPLELELFGDPLAGHLDAADVIRLTLSRLYELPELPA